MNLKNDNNNMKDLNSIDNINNNNNNFDEYNINNININSNNSNLPLNDNEHDNENNNQNKILQVKKFCEILYTSKSSNEIKIADIFLNAIIKYENLRIFLYFLLYENNTNENIESNIYTKFYSSNALIKIYTKNYNQMDANLKNEIFLGVQNLLVNKLLLTKKFNYTKNYFTLIN
jgi:hypothetical protein